MNTRNISATTAIIVFRLGKEKISYLRPSSMTHDRKLLRTIPVDLDLATFKSSYHHQRSILVRVLWYLVNAIFYESAWFPIYGLKRIVLRCFGAEIGHGVVIKPRVSIKFPWNLSVGAHCWIGESVWFDNLGMVTIGDNVCVSQGVYFCTGSHDFHSSEFGLKVAGISVGSGSWLCARSMILQGVALPNRTLVPAGTVVDTRTT